MTDRQRQASIGSAEPRQQVAQADVPEPDHDQAVAADALRQAADAAADNCASVLNDDDPTEANRWADTEHWLRARAEAVGDE